ncbi:hypothetical protein BKA70DRAFT_7014 [Coprinopsis sp. MPI-PUGE-AT-0042]|nr:hypothetical protein BKA70DRAFT_7014 [Coprinopsis sp. MPI-PUGE-AT-0042]
MASMVKKEPDEDGRAANVALYGSRRGYAVTKPEEYVQDRLNNDHVAISGVFQAPPKKFVAQQRISQSESTPERSNAAVKDMLSTFLDALGVVRFHDQLRYEALRTLIERMLKTVGTPPKTIIAVCGATGVGKSSLLNALIDKAIVPTSSMRACTSVVTEITYHNSQRIAADVHFLTREEWEQEVSLILRELTSDEDEDSDEEYDDDDDDSSENDEERLDPDSPAGIAWAKVHAVYPTVEYRRLIKSSSSRVLSLDPAIASKLGTTKRVVAGDPDTFREAIAKYIDAQAPDEDAITSALWPLIKKVTIYCNAKVLSTGAMFVDLPGVADSNAARDKIAKDYFSQANHFFILGAITRAVSDKTARDLMEESRKRQLMMDGNYDHRRITFIGTKCDDVDCKEVIRDCKLQRRQEVKDYQAMKKEAKRKKSLAKGAGLDTQDSQLKGLQKRLKEVRQRQQQLDEDDSDIYVKSPSSRKRKSGRLPMSSGRCKRPFGSAPNDASDEEKSLEALQEEERQLVDAIKAATREEDNSHTNLADKEMRMRAFCSLERSKYAREELQRQFRAGVKQMERDMEENDPEGSPTGNVPRDYDEIKLPVFTCSSRDYNRLKGNDEDDSEPTCFSNIEDTGIPGLQEWIHIITMASRHRAARDSLSQLSSLTRSIRAFSETPNVSIAEKEAIRQCWGDGGIRRRLEMTLLAPSRNFVEEQKVRFRSGLEGRCKAGAAKASRSAVHTFGTFSDIKRMRWQTFRAVLRRHGQYRVHNLNQDLLDPFTISISRAWIMHFNAVPFEELEAAITESLDEFADAFLTSLPPVARERLKSLVETCMKTAQDLLPQLIHEAKSAMTQQRKHVSSSLNNHVEVQLEDTYDLALVEKGKGSARRQRLIVQDAIEKRKRQMFDSAGYTTLEGTDSASNMIGLTLKKPLVDLAAKIEMDLSTSWEVVPNDAPQVRARQYLLTLADEIQGQINLRLEAARRREEEMRKSDHPH